MWQKREIINHLGIRILTISPGAWPLKANPRHRHRRWRNSPGEGSFPSWTLRPPLSGKPSSSSLPPLGESPLSPPRLQERSPPRSHQTTDPIPPGAGNFFGFPWPSSWPSSPVPHRVPGPAAPLSGHPLGLREGEPDSLPVRTSSASPVKGIGSF